MPPPPTHPPPLMRPKTLRLDEAQASQLDFSFLPGSTTRGRAPPRIQVSSSAVPGLRPGDLLVQINGIAVEDITSREELKAILDSIQQWPVSFVAQCHQNHKEEDSEEPSSSAAKLLHQLAHTAAQYKAIWPLLTKQGWKSGKGTGMESARRYVLPQFTRDSKRQQRKLVSGVDFLSSPEEVVQFCLLRGIDLDSSPEEIRARCLPVEAAAASASSASLTEEEAKTAKRQPKKKKKVEEEEGAGEEPSPAAEEEETATPAKKRARKAASSSSSKGKKKKKGEEEGGGDEFDFKPVPSITTTTTTTKKRAAAAAKRRRRARDDDSDEEEAGVMELAKDDDDAVMAIVDDDDDYAVAPAPYSLRPRTRRMAKQEDAEMLALAVQQIDALEEGEGGAAACGSARRGRLSKEEREEAQRYKLPRFLAQIPAHVKPSSGGGGQRSASPAAPAAASSLVVEQDGDGQIDLTLSSDDEDSTANGAKEEEEEDDACLVAAVAAAAADDGDEEVQHVPSTTYQRGQILHTRYGVCSVRYDYDSARDTFLQVLFLWDMRQRIFPFAALNLKDEAAEVVLDCTKQIVLRGENMNRSDLARLWPGMYLNDTLINYFLRRTLQVDSPPAVRARVHVMTTHFFSKLVKKQMSSVRTWTKNVDIFDKDFILVPVNEAEHWSLAIICFPGSLATAAADDGAITVDDDDEENADKDATECARVLREAVDDVVASEDARVPVILKLDSTKGHATRLVSDLLRKWLAQESEWKRNRKIQVTATALPIVAPEAPLQDNGCDCGVFLLAFAQHFLAKLNDNGGDNGDGFASREGAIRKRFRQEFGHDWFPSSRILEMREGMHKHILAEQERENE